MSRYGITYEEVRVVADELLRQNQNPTIEIVRQKLGSGSNTTLSKHLNAWRGQRILKAVKEDPPKILPTDEISRAVDQVWQHLTEQARHEIEQIKHENETKILSLTEANEQLLQEKASLEKTVDQLTLQLNHLQTDITLLKKELAENQQARAMAEESTKQAKETLHHLQLQNQHYTADLKASYEKSNKQLIEQQQAELDAFKTLLENQRTDFMVKVDALSTLKDKAEKALLKTGAELQQYQQRYQTLSEDKKLLEVDLKVANAKIEEQQQQMAVQEKEIIQLRTQLEQPGQRYAALQEQIIVLEQKLMPLLNHLSLEKVQKDEKQGLTLNTAKAKPRKEA